MKPNRTISSFAFFTASICIAVCCTSTCTAQVILTVPAEVTVDSRDVQAGDIVLLSRTDSGLASQLSEIDIAAMEPFESEIHIRKSYVRIRLMLAGWGKDKFVVNGPETIRVTYEEAAPITDADIEAAAMKTMATVLGAKAEDLRVRLNRPFMESLPTSVREVFGLRVEVAAPVKPSLGSNSLTVRLLNGQNLVTTRIGHFGVLKRHRVAVTRVSLQRDVTIDRNDVQFESRFLSSAADEPQEDDIYGQTVKSPVKAGALLSLRDIARPLPQHSEIVVKTRDKVQVTAISGLLRIRMRQAEALQSGRVGDLISLRNLDSHQVITGRVAGPGVVEIRLR